MRELMIQIKRAASAYLVILAMVTSVAALTATPAAAQTVHWVNVNEATPTPPGTSCANAGYTSIAAAVVAAVAGDTIVVCPGTYAESVTVDKSITLRGFNTTIGRCFGTLTPDPSQDTIVNPPGAFAGTGFNVTAENVSIRGFTITDADTGIQTAPTTAGHLFIRNTLLLNRFGIQLHTDGDALTTVTTSCFHRNAAAANGNAITSSVGIENVHIRDNLFFGTVHVAPATEAGDIVLFGGVRDVRIFGNVSRESETFAALTGAVDSTISGNSINGNASASPALAASAIFIGNDVAAPTTGMLVSRNVITDARRGIRTFTFPAATTTATGVNIALNRVNGMIEDGIVAETGSLTNSLIARNNVARNGQDGIHIDNGTGNSGNVIRFNAARLNAAFDCHDETTGGGTLGTANTWLRNRGTTSSPAGLCRP
ncbi:hypothetical protein [Nonomuraea sp. 10N515B]|uniref:hypothetical protein n=1 Tax=Nonomuraea sp. 10N515B TaxID=3457422 RepID=UPI003FCC941F